MSIQVELLFIEGCSRVNETREMVKDVIKETGIKANVREVIILTNEEAAKHRFVGSPSIRVDGIDIEAGNRPQKQYGVQCRIYRTGNGLRGVPSREMLVQALSIGKTRNRTNG